jgi:DNA-binding response OmpR family regulator
MASEVLVVDDEEIMLDLLEAFLDRYNCRTTKAADGDTAIEALESANFDLVITDLHMSRINGMEVLKKAKALRPETIVFIITGCNEKASAQKAFDLGVDDYLLKPFNLSLLMERLNRHGFSPQAANATS